MPMGWIVTIFCLFLYSVYLGASQWACTSAQNVGWSLGCSPTWRGTRRVFISPSSSSARAGRSSHSNRVLIATASAMLTQRFPSSSLLVVGLLRRCSSTQRRGTPRPRHSLPSLCHHPLSGEYKLDFCELGQTIKGMYFLAKIFWFNRSHFI